MPCERSLARDRAREIWLASGRAMKLCEVAQTLGVSEAVVRSWKNKDKWTSTEPVKKNKSSVPNQKPRSVPVHRATVPLRKTERNEQIQAATESAGTSGTNNAPPPPPPKRPDIAPSSLRLQELLYGVLSDEQRLVALSTPEDPLDTLRISLQLSNVTVLNMMKSRDELSREVEKMVAVEGRKRTLTGASGETLHSETMSIVKTKRDKIAEIDRDIIRAQAGQLRTAQKIVDLETMRMRIEQERYVEQTSERLNIYYDYGDVNANT